MANKTTSKTVAAIVPEVTEPPIEAETQEIGPEVTVPANMAVAIRQASNLMPPVEDIEKLSAIFYKSKVFRDITDAAQAAVKIMAGLELGLTPLYSMQNFYLVNGRVGTTAQLVASLVKKSGKYDFRTVDWTDQACSIMFYEAGKEVLKSTFTMDDARRAKLVKAGGAWETYPKDLLWARALMQGSRKVCPEVVMGLYTKEELEGITADNPVKAQPAGAISPPAIENPPAVAEAKNTGPVTAPGITSVEIVDTPMPPGMDTWRYAALINHCPLKDHNYEPWKVSKFGKRFHTLPNKGFCNFRDVVKPYKDAIMKKHGLTDDTLNEQLKKQFGGKTWSQLPEGEQMVVLFVLDTADQPGEAPVDKSTAAVTAGIATAKPVQAPMGEPPPGPDELPPIQ